MTTAARSFVMATILSLAFGLLLNAAPMHRGELIFPLEHWHNHGSCIVEAPNGEIIVCWFHGSGERSADDVVILGAKRDPATSKWTKPFLMADTPEFPDTNCCMIVDPAGQLWLFWPTIQANLWQSALMNYKVSDDYQKSGAAPVWKKHAVLHMKPGTEFPKTVRTKFVDYLSKRELTLRDIEWAHGAFEQADDKLTRRLGWFTRARPILLDDGRLLVGLYSDGFHFSMVAYTDNWGESWGFSEPMVGTGNIQPTFARKKDGTIVAYMRDAGPPPKRVHVSESSDRGETWGKVYDHPVLPNPGAGLELMNLSDGRFLVIYNDTERGRHSLAVAISEDEGKTFRWTRHLELVEPGSGSFHYPAIMQSKDGMLHASYSYFVRDPNTGEQRKTIKYATFNIEWVEAGDGR